MASLGFSMNLQPYWRFLLANLCVLFLSPLALHTVILWMNTVGPYANHQESYAFYSLPFCQGPKKGISHYHETFGEALLGVELQPSGLNIDFQGVFEFAVILEVF